MHDFLINPGTQITKAKPKWILSNIWAQDRSTVVDLTDHQHY
jgi:hypothetical protein